MKKFPAVSVIMPMYNAARYVDDCLKSFLAQTFTDFELIVVDDCSTDNSVAIVEKFSERFGDRLKLTRTKKNSGGGGYVGRNMGLNLSRGEYIFFADADDYVAENALEIFFTAAKNFDADVVYTPMHYVCDGERIDTLGDAQSARAVESGVADETTLTVGKRNEICRSVVTEFSSTPWTKFVRRKFLIDNDITFPKIISGGDFVWSIAVAGCARRWLRLPAAVYFYRVNHDSITQKKRSVEEQLNVCAKSFLLGANALHELSKKISPLKEEPDLIFLALKDFWDACLQRTVDVRAKISAEKIFATVYAAFAAENNLSRLTVPFFLSAFDVQQKISRQDKAYISELENFIMQSQRRVAELEAEVNRLRGVSV